VRHLAKGRSRLLEARYLLPQDEVLRLQHTLYGREDLPADFGVFSGEIQQGNGPECNSRGVLDRSPVYLTLPHPSSASVVHMKGMLSP
jgi:hypothetical protein